MRERFVKNGTLRAYLQARIAMLCERQDYLEGFGRSSVYEVERLNVARCLAELEKIKKICEERGRY